MVWHWMQKLKENVMKIIKWKTLLKDCWPSWTWQYFHPVCPVWHDCEKFWIHKNTGAQYNFLLPLIQNVIQGAKDGVQLFNQGL